MGKLSIVGTPIGNLEDITLRALRTLKEATVIFAEDTRVAKKLLSRYEIDTPCERCDANTERICAGRVIARLSRGEHVAFVSDAGTPGISDPGALLVRMVREKCPEATIEAIPGPSALATALSISGIQGSSFHFLGFLPHKKGRLTAFRRIAETEEPVVFFESTHRILKTLESLKEHVPQKRVTIARELTKFFEEVVTGAPEEVIAELAKDTKRTKGEFVVIVE